MSEAFDPYHRWLGIHSKDQPPHHYRLLGIDLFEDDPEVIRDATERQMAHVRKYQLGPHSEISQKILNELAGAKACLFDRDKKAAYDTAIKAKLTAINSSTEQFTPSSTTLIAEESPFSTLSALAEVKTTSHFGKKAFRQNNKNWSLYIGLGTAVILGGILVTILETLGNNRDSTIPNLRDRIAQATAPEEQSPPNKHASNKTPGDEIPVEPIVSESSAKTPPADNQSTSSDNKVASIESAGGDFFPPAQDKTTEEPRADSPKVPLIKIPEAPIPEPTSKPPETIITKPPPEIPPNDTPSPFIRFQKIVDHLVLAFNKKDYLDMGRDFAFSFPVKLFVPKCRGLMSNYGKISSLEPLRTIKIDRPGNKNIIQASYTAHCDRGTVEIYIWINDQDQIVDLLFKPIK